MSMPNRIAVPVTLAGQQASVAARTATLEQLRERLEAGEPPEKKVTRMTEEEQRLVQQALQRNLFSMARQIPMKIKINGKGEAKTSGSSREGRAPGLECRTHRGWGIVPGRAHGTEVLRWFCWVFLLALFSGSSKSSPDSEGCLPCSQSSKLVKPPWPLCPAQEVTRGPIYRIYR